MATRVFSLEGDLRLNSASFEAGAERARRAFERTQQSIAADTSRIRTTVTGLQAAFVGFTRGLIGGAAGAVGLVGITQVFRTMIQETEQAQQAQLRLSGVLRATGGTAGLTQREISELGDEFERTRLVTSEMALDAASALATFRSVSGEAFTRTLGLAQDLAAVFGGDLRSSTIQLGKALEDPITGLASLRRVGVSFTETQKALIEGFVETGEKARAQTLILDTLEQQVGGAGAAEASGLTGAFHRASNAVGNMLERLGELSGVAPTVQAALEGIAAAADRMFQTGTVAGRIAELQAEQQRLVEMGRLAQQAEPSFATGAVLAVRGERLQALDAEIAGLRRLQTAAEQAAALSRDTAAQAAAQLQEQEEIERRRALVAEALGGFIKAQAKAEDERAEKAARAAEKAQAEERERQRRIAAIGQEAADLERLAAAQREGQAAYEAMARVIAAENEVRGIGLDVTGAVGRALVEEIVQRERLRDGIDQTNAAREREAATAKQQQATFQREIERIREQLLTPSARLAEREAELVELRRQGLDQVTFERALAAARQETAEQTGRLAEQELQRRRDLDAGIERSLRDYVGFATDAALQAEDAITSGFRAAEDAVAHFATTGKLEFGAFADAVLADLARIATRQVLAFGANAALSFLFPGANVGLVPDAAAAGVPGGGFARGAVVDEGRIVPFGRGGVVDRPRLFPLRDGAGLMGEAGPEAILPLRRDDKGNLGVIAGAAGSGVRIEIHNHDQRAAGAPIETRASVGRDGRVVIEQWLRDSVEAMTGRGELDRAMRGRFGLRPQPVR